MSLIRNPVAVATIILIGSLLVYAAYSIQATPGAVTTPVPSGFTVGGSTFQFNYTATTQAQREAGLMNKVVTESTTMLFAFPSLSEWQFWMYDTNTTLDMIWVNATGTSGVVVFLVTSAQPCFDRSSCQLYTPSAPANYVIEARGGFAAAHGITVGTRIGFSK